MSTTNGHANGVDRKPARKRQFLQNPTSIYRPGGSWWGYPSAILDGAPFFTWLDIPRMLRDPRVRFVERMWRAPFQRVKWRVKAEDPRVEKFVDTQLRRFWRNSLPKLLSRYFRYGFAPGGAEYVAHKGQVRLDRVRTIEPRDSRPLLWTSGPRAGQPAGFVLSATGAGSPWGPPGSNEGPQKNQQWIAAPHAFWFAGYGEFGPWFDSPPMSGMFEPWLEKRGRGGAIHARRLWYRKCAFRGGKLRYPEGVSRLGPDEGSATKDNADIARETLEQMETGGVFIGVNDFNGQSDKYAWDYEEALAQPDIKGVREYPQDLDSEMLEGAGIPRDALESTETGSGWSGKIIPLMGFLGGVDELAGMVIDAADVGWLKHVTHLNFGTDTWYEIEAMSLAEEVQQAAKSGKGGGEAPNPLTGMFSGKPAPDQQGGSLSLSMFDESKVHRDHGKFASQDGTSGAGEPESHEDSKARRIMRALSGIPKRAVKKARQKVSDTYAKLESRYGPGYARVIVGAGVAGLPIPMPGASVMMAAPVLAIAELHRKLAQWGSPAPESIDQEGVVKPAARWFLGRILGRARGALHLSDGQADTFGNSLMGLRKRDLVRLAFLAMLKAQEEATAKGNPEAAKEELKKLVKLARDPAGVQDATGSKELSWAAFELSWGRMPGPRSQNRWVNSKSGTVRYQKNKPGERKDQRDTAVSRSRELVLKVHTGKATAEDLQKLAFHIEYLPVARLRRLREILGAKFNNARQRDKMVDALLAHVRGMRVPEEKKLRRAASSESLYQIVRGKGGINPDSASFKASYANIAEAREMGISLGVFRKGGAGLDELAEELHDDGYINVPDNVHAGEHLLNELARGAMSRHADLSKQYEKALHEHYQAIAEAENYPDRSTVEEALRLGEEAGLAEGSAGSLGPVRESDRPGDANEEELDSADTSFDVDELKKPPAAEVPDMATLHEFQSDSPDTGPKDRFADAGTKAAAAAAAKRSGPAGQA